MSVFERSEWQSGFPFSPSRLRATGERIPDSSAETNPSGNAPLPPRNPTYPPNSAEVPGDDQDPENAHLAAIAKLIARPLARAGRPAGPQPGLRLLPIAAFVWGSPARPPQPRTRPDHTLIWVTEGRMQLDFPRRHHIMRRGDLRLIPAGTAFATLPAPGAEGHVALISAALAGRSSPAFPVEGLSAHIGGHGPQFLATLNDLAAEARAPQTATIACLMNLLSLRLSQLEPERDRIATTPPPLPDRPLVERFLALAATRLGSCDLIAEMAAQLNTTSAALDRACLAARGQRAVELVHRLRLDRAVRVLRETDTLPARIASELGYTSHAHFTRAFVAATGRTPEVFRAQSRS
ncbi:helix-turn-helix transcriptional regulator [Paracoccus caeni]|uniref:Helix-turn-helix transcriptional regulator n=1 Tax=Paracoccus caeni TaxID=657651 RepID=A0A934W0I0_9RHOB|nr:AraC family transcriptional regulator [Paracoccus caeni]MBK4216960.1 helix-turn-helix transcriptional regulator [Paracoccus caeni]